MLALTFNNKEDYEKILENDAFNLIDLESFSVSRKLKLEIIHDDSTVDVILCNHTYNETQIEWFKAGSALNLIRLAQ